VIDALAEKQFLSGCPGLTEVFGLSEARDGVNMGACLPVDAPIVPIITSWLANNLMDKAKFVFKIRLFSSALRAPENKDLAYMAFIQGVYEVITGIVPVTMDEAISLAALQMQVKFGDAKPDAHTKGFLSRSGQLKGMVPGPLLMRRAMASWDEDILARHRVLNADARARPMQLYCQMLMTREFYGAEYVPAAQAFSPDTPESVLVAVSYAGVHVLGMDDKRVIDRFTFGEIYRWGFDAKKDFYVELKPQCSRPDAPCTAKPSGGKGNLFVFTTKQGRTASDMLTAYATRILAEIQGRGAAAGGAAGASASTALDSAARAASKRAASVAAATKVQALWRGSRVRQSLQEEAAAIRVQAVWRGMLARAAFDRMLEEAEAEFAEDE